LAGVNFRARLAQMLSFGMVPGWMNVQYFTPLLEQAKNAATLRFFVGALEVRTRLADYLVYGRMLRPPRVVSEIADVKMSDGCFVPGVLGSAWESADNLENQMPTMILLVINHTPETVNYTAHVELGLGAGPSRLISVLLAPLSVLEMNLRPSRVYKSDGNSTMKLDATKGVASKTDDSLGRATLTVAWAVHTGLY
jgi:hypothetical protein